MNIWGVLFCLPMFLLIIFNPLEMIPSLILFVVWLAAWLVIFEKVLGKKDD